MKKILFTILILGAFQIGLSQTTFVREWATYFGDSGLSIAGSTELKGNLYLVGKAKNSTFMGTIINPDNNQYASGGGEWDGFIAKFSPEGQLIWLTYYGGVGDDEITDITADDTALYVVGKTTNNSMATNGVHQTSLSGISDGFIASFDENGNRNWHTYFGGEGKEHIISLTHQDNSLYLYGYTTSHTNIATSGAFQETIDVNGGNGNYINNFIAEFNKTGQRIWATYYGIIDYYTTEQTYPKTPLTGITVNETGLFVSGWDVGGNQQLDTTYFGTPDAFLEIRPTAVTGIGMSLYLSKFSFNGSRLWSTYFSAYSSTGNPVTITPFAGGTISQRALSPIIATSNGVYISGITIGNYGIGTQGSFQPTKTGPSAFFITHFSDAGERLWGSYLGNGITGSEYGDLNALSSDSQGNIYISGSTSRTTTDLATPDGFQVVKNDLSDFYFAKITPDGTTKIYGSYYGGNDNETDGWGVPIGNNFYLIGTTVSSDDIATSGAWQEEFFYGGEETKNIFITKFTPEEDLSTQNVFKNKFAIYPNPNNGNFAIDSQTPLENITIQIFDMQGRKVYLQKVTNLKMVDVSLNLPLGIYLLKLTTENNTIYTNKIIIKN
jgi:hypothetical protein